MMKMVVSSIEREENAGDVDDSLTKRKEMSWWRWWLSREGAGDVGDDDDVSYSKRRR